MRALLVSMVLVVGCSSESVPPVGLATHALDCAADEICPDGTACPEDGVCPEPGDGWAGDCDGLAQDCANFGGDGPDPQACADWLAACFPNVVAGGGDDPAADGAECGALALACLNDGAIPDREACDQWLDGCAPGALQDFVGDDLAAAAERACGLLDTACDQGIEDGCWLYEELCPFDGAVDPAALAEHGCGLLAEACGRGFGPACDVAQALGCAGAADGADDDAGGDDAGVDDPAQGGDCTALLQACTSDFERDVCFEWLETCAPPEWRGEGPECAASLEACGGGDLASCQAWLQSCPPDSVRRPECLEVLTACYAGDGAECAEIQNICL